MSCQVNPEDCPIFPDRENWLDISGTGVSLAPFYDLLSAVAYPDLSPNLAMKIARQATIEEIGPTTLPPAR